MRQVVVLLSFDKFLPRNYLKYFRVHKSLNRMDEAAEYRVRSAHVLFLIFLSPKALKNRDPLNYE